MCFGYKFLHKLELLPCRLPDEWSPQPAHYGQHEPVKYNLMSVLHYKLEQVMYTSLGMDGFRVGYIGWTKLR